MRIIGSCFSPDTVRLREFAARNRLPHNWIDLERDKQAERLPQRFGISPAETPVVIFGGNVLRNPINTELARLVGLPAPDTLRDECDVVVGTGPAGLAAVLYSDGDQRTARRQRAILETSRPGVFAAGDVRSGSVKRVASAVGEGSMAIRQIHEYFGV